MGKHLAGTHRAVRRPVDRHLIFGLGVITVALVLAAFVPTMTPNL